MLTQLSKHMFTNTLTISTCPAVAKKQQETVPVRKPQSTSPWFVPRFDDTLFWCFYIMRYSLSDYELVSASGFKEEHSLKIGFVQTIRNDPAFMKAHKICRASLENEMVNDKKITLVGFKALCLFHKIRAIVTRGSMFIEVAPDASGSFIIQSRKGKYGLLVRDCPNVQDYTKNLIGVVAFTKPLRAQSSYKLADLERMCRTLGISWEGKAQKKQLYDKLLVGLTKEPECPI